MLDASRSSKQGSRESTASTDSSRLPYHPITSDKLSAENSITSPTLQTTTSPTISRLSLSPHDTKNGSAEQRKAEIGTFDECGPRLIRGNWRKVHVVGCNCVV